MGALAWSAYKAKIEGDRMVLILIFKNAQVLVEAVMWDLFRLKSWYYQNVSIMVIDDKSDDDTFYILKKLQKRFSFILISASMGKSLEQILNRHGNNVGVISISGADNPRLVRKKIFLLLNRCYYEEEPPLRKYS